MKLFFSLISFLIAGLSFAQNATISGKITDVGGEPLYNASVVVDAAKGWATITDFDGNYELSLPSGEHLLFVKYLGMKDDQLLIQVTDNENRTLNFTLTTNPKIITEVQVSATKRGISAEREVVSIESVSTEMLVSNNLTNGADAMDRVTGITLLDGQASIRGGSGYAYGTGSRVILVIDDIPLLSPERSEVLWDFIPMENLKTFEVVKGASSVQYGSAALNGIVNVTTAWPKKKKETEITLFSAMYDNPPIEQAKWWEYSIQDYREDPHEMGFTVTHRRKLTDELDFVINGTMNSNQTHIQNQSLHKIRNNIKLRYRPEKIKGLTTGLNTNLFYRNKDVFFIWEGFNEGAYQGQSFKDQYIRTTFDPYVKYFFKDKNRIGSFNRIYYDKRLDSEYFSVTVYNDFQYQRQYKSDSSDISGTTLVGIVNSQNIIKSPSFRDYSAKGDAVFHINNVAPYVQGDISIHNLTLAAGSRFDWISIDGTTKASKPVFNAGASYKIGENNFVRSSYGGSFRIPSIAERYVFEEITSLSIDTIRLPVYAGPNPDVQPESGYSIEFGYKRKLANGKWDGFIDAVVFYQGFDDMVEFTFGDYVNPLNNESYLGFRSENIAQARIFGWEVSGNTNGKIGRFPVTIQAGYTYNYPANAEEDPELNKFGKVFTNSFKAFKISDEEHKAFATGADTDNILNGLLRYRFRHTVKFDASIDIDDFSFGTNLRYYSYMDRVDLIFATFIPGIQDYRNTLSNKGEIVVDFRTSYRFTEQFSMGFIVKNAFNNNYQLRPAKPDAPRTFTLQGRINF